MARVEQWQPVTRAGRARGEAGVGRPAPPAPARRRRAPARRRSRGRASSGSSASSAPAWSRRPFVASSTSRRARSSRATASASARRTSRGQLGSPSSRAIATLRVGEAHVAGLHCTAAEPSRARSRRPPARPAAAASPPAGRGRDRSVLRPSPITSRVARGPQCRAEVDRNATFRSYRRGGAEPLPAAQGAPSCALRTLPREPRARQQRHEPPRPLPLVGVAETLEPALAQLFLRRLGQRVDERAGAARPEPFPPAPPQWGRCGRRAPARS